MTSQKDQPYIQLHTSVHSSLYATQGTIFGLRAIKPYIEGTSYDSYWAAPFDVALTEIWHDFSESTNIGELYPLIYRISQLNVIVEYFQNKVNNDICPEVDEVKKYIAQAI